MTTSTTLGDIVLADRWRFRKRLGHGADGSVYLAVDEGTEQQVAIKVYDSLVGRDTGWLLDRIRTEVELTRIARSPSLVEVYHYGVADTAGGADTAYVVMEYLKGSTLREMMEQLGARETMRDPLRMLRRMLDAVDSLHQHGVLHLDLKPGNFFIIDPDAVPQGTRSLRLLDLASARTVDSTTEGFARGTPLYASPEMCLRTRDVGRPSDVYSLGVVLFELVVGHPPVRTGSAEQIVAQHVYGQLEKWPAGADPRLGPIYRRAVAREPWHRFADAGAMLDALNRL